MTAVLISHTLGVNACRFRHSTFRPAPAGCARLLVRVAGPRSRRRPLLLRERCSWPLHGLLCSPCGQCNSQAWPLSKECDAHAVNQHTPSHTRPHALRPRTPLTSHKPLLRQRLPQKSSRKLATQTQGWESESPPSPRRSEGQEDSQRRRVGQEEPSPCRRFVASLTAYFERAHMNKHTSELRKKHN